MRTWQVVLKESIDIQNDTKLLELEQDYLLLSLNDAIEENDLQEKDKLIESLHTIQNQISSNNTRRKALKNEYEAINLTSKPKQR
ncbi:hypothetical protein [Bacillus sp. FJAT-22090]|uniref:hypothetical protein n=1 Tax=Bacillus sp. FJAT-22090 TaxID=1581038 RepID=UPI0011A37217|nr:hypothetical protein [Bacillus sp. FJAT-22090]